MKCLALDTTTDICSIAIADESGMIGQYDFAHRMDLSRRLMPNVNGLLKDSGMEMKDVEAVGVSLGPGSFTGLRIGATTAKTLAQVLEIPIVGIVTPDLIACQFEYLPNAIVCPLTKVRKGEVYYAFFQISDGSVERTSEYEAGPIREVIDHVAESPEGNVIFCGDALAEYMPVLEETLGKRASFAPPWLAYPKASILAQKALERISRGEADDPLALVPFYIRRSAPEMRLECRLAGE